MTTEPKLPTADEWRDMLIGHQFDMLEPALRERGLIAQEPVDPVADVMRMIRNMDDDCEIERAIREITKPPVLTREMVNKALRAALTLSEVQTIHPDALERAYTALQEQLK